MNNLASQLIPRTEMSDDQQQSQLALMTNIYPSADTPMLAMIYDYCLNLQLDPMNKPVHPVPMNGKTLILPGINTYRIMATRSGHYLGHSQPVLGPTVTYNFCNFTQEAKRANHSPTLFNLEVPCYVDITVYRAVNGLRAEFPVRQYWLENYACNGTKPWDCPEGHHPAPNAMWLKRQIDQLVKCCESQALRHAFPESCTGNTMEEMAGKELDMGTLESNQVEVSAPIDDLTAPQSTKAKDTTPEEIKEPEKKQPEPKPEPTPQDVVMASANQVEKLLKRIASLKLDDAVLLAHFKIEAWSQLPASRVKEVSQYARSLA